MRLAFLGSGAFATPSLEHLQRKGLAPLAVITQPDRPAGRGRQPTSTSVKLVADSLGLPVAQPQDIGSPPALALLRELRLEFLVVVSYGQILPQEVLSVPSRAAVNLHASLLPRWRGAAPVARAILAGDQRTGLTTIRMDAGVDTGQLLLQQEVRIGERETAGELEERLARLGGPLLEETLSGLRSGSLRGRAQPSLGVTRAPRLSVEEARLDWTLPARDLDRRVRAFNPRPVAWTEYRGERLRIWRARPAPRDEGRGNGGPVAPGTVVLARGDTLRVACGGSSLDLEEIQPAGGRRISARDAVNGRTLPIHAHLGL